VTTGQPAPHPGQVRIPADPFLGTFGVAPSRALLEQITAREQALLEAGGPVMVPDPGSAVPVDPLIAAAGLRTMPPREDVGNVDIPQTGVSARLLLPVWTPGALFSASDAHYAQGEGQARGAAIGMTAGWRLWFDLRKGEATDRGQRRLRFERRGFRLGSEEPERYFATIGICVDRHGRNPSENVTIAARAPCMK
jgi:formamidase